MSSGTRNLAPSLLVVSNRVYAKAGDGVFYSGSIESKPEENSYVVRFADDKKRVVREQDLVWLSFYGLPSSLWPENPVVEPIISSDDTFEGTLQFVGNGTKAPASFTVRRSNEDETSNSLRGRDDDCPGAGKLLLGDRDKHTQGPPCGQFPEEQGVKQARSSVLRLNRDLLHEECWDNNYHRSSTPSLNETMNLIPGYTSGKNPEPQIQHKYSVKVTPMHRGGPYYSPKAMYKTGGLTGRETKKEQIRDWGDIFAVNQSSFTPPITPCVSADCNSPRRRRLAGAICESVPRGESTIPAWGMENTQLLKKGHAKKRKKRSETRKCRKVYGIDHREAWCLPCRWKKACTRFRECEKKN